MVTQASNVAPTNLEPASDWVRRWAHLVKPGGRVLDVACGQGRNAYHFFELNHPLTLIDRSQSAIESIAIEPVSCEKIVADIENDAWPLAGRQFAAVVVTNYLWRPLWSHLLAGLAKDGVLIYETFASGNETIGKPSRPEFLLQPRELLEVCKALRVVAFEDGFLAGTDGRSPRFIQRIAAVQETPASCPPVRYKLVQ